MDWLEGFFFVLQIECNMRKLKNLFQFWFNMMHFLLHTCFSYDDATALAVVQPTSRPGGQAGKQAGSHSASKTDKPLAKVQKLLMRFSLKLFASLQFYFFYSCFRYFTNLITLLWLHQIPHDHKLINWKQEKKLMDGVECEKIIVFIAKICGASCCTQINMNVVIRQCSKLCVEIIKKKLFKRGFEVSEGAVANTLALYRSCTGQPKQVGPLAGIRKTTCTNYAASIYAGVIWWTSHLQPS